MINITLGVRALNFFKKRLNCQFQDDDIHIGFLPLAHVLELLSENAYIILGVPIGYSSPYTLIDTSIAIKSGEVNIFYFQILLDIRKFEATFKSIFQWLM
jgi:hypothetical protein